MADENLPAGELGKGVPAQNLLPLVYAELRKLAAARMASESPGHTLDAIALVHEVFLRVGSDQSFTSKSAFLRAAAEAMRRILVDHARAQQADKRGGKRNRVELIDQVGSMPDDDLLALDEALAQLATIDPQAAELVQLRYFSGLTIPQAAEALGMAPRSADRLWSFARAWLLRELSEKDEKSPQ